MRLSNDLGINTIHISHSNHSLLFQFIFTEFIELFEKFHHLDILVQQSHSHFTDYAMTPLSPLHKYTLIETAFKNFIELEEMRTLYWNTPTTALKKLKKYSDLFFSNHEQHNKTALTIQHYLDKIANLCLKAKEIFNTDTHEFGQIIDSIDKFKQAIHRLGKAILKNTQQFNQNEDVIFCLLRHRKRFETLYNSPLLFKQLLSIFPNGLSEIDAMLKEKYTKRGFHHLLPIIEMKITELRSLN